MVAQVYYSYETKTFYICNKEKGNNYLKQIQDSGNLFTIAMRDNSAHLSDVILLSVLLIDSPNFSPGFSVAATSNKSENVGPGQRRHISTPLPT